MDSYELEFTDAVAYSFLTGEGDYNFGDSYNTFQEYEFSSLEEVISAVENLLDLHTNGEVLKGVTHMGQQDFHTIVDKDKVTAKSIAMMWWNQKEKE